MERGQTGLSLLLGAGRDAAAHHGAVRAALRSSTTDGAELPSDRVLRNFLRNLDAKGEGGKEDAEEGRQRHWAAEFSTFGGSAASGIFVGF